METRPAGKPRDGAEGCFRQLLSLYVAAVHSVNSIESEQRDCLCCLTIIRRGANRSLKCCTVATAVIISFNFILDDLQCLLIVGMHEKIESVNVLGETKMLE